MLSITDLKTGTKISIGDEPYIVLSYSQSKMGRGGSIVKVKIKNLKTGSTLSKTYQGAEKIDEASLSKKSAQFLYSDNSDAYFMDSASFEQFSIPLSQIGEQKNYLVEGTETDILYYNNQPINIDLPIKMKFKVTEAPPGVRGNTAGAATKPVVIETGTKVDTPLFIKVGDIIVVDTRDGKYVERG
jgi:elongation factor P